MLGKSFIRQAPAGIHAPLTLRCLQKLSRLSRLKVTKLVGEVPPWHILISQCAVFCVGFTSTIPLTFENICPAGCSASLSLAQILKHQCPSVFTMKIHYAEYF
jgi:hypothetical protein